jgi:hypothetical protein
VGHDVNNFFNKKYFSYLSLKKLFCGNFDVKLEFHCHLVCTFNNQYFRNHDSLQRSDMIRRHKKEFNNLSLLKNGNRVIGHKETGEKKPKMFPLKKLN